MLKAEFPCVNLCFHGWNIGFHFHTCNASTHCAVYLRANCGSHSLPVHYVHPVSLSVSCFLAWSLIHFHWKISLKESRVHSQSQAFVALPAKYSLWIPGTHLPTDSPSTLCCSPWIFPEPCSKDCSPALSSKTATCPLTLFWQFSEWDQLYLILSFSFSILPQYSLLPVTEFSSFISKHYKTLNCSYSPLFGYKKIQIMIEKAVSVFLWHNDWSGHDYLTDLK